MLFQKRGDVAVGLVTGNLEPIAWGKMQALGLLEAFSEPHFGGFGSDYCSGAHQASRRLPACHFQRVARASAGWYTSAHIIGSAQLAVHVCGSHQGGSAVV